MEKQYILKSADGVNLKVSSEVISRCDLLRFVIEDCALEMEKNRIIPIPRVKSETLETLINLAEIIGSQPQSCEEFFLSVDVNNFLLIVNAADYLISEDILDIASKVIPRRISEDSFMERLSKLGSPSRDGRFASIMETI